MSNISINVGDRSAYKFLSPFDTIMSNMTVYDVTNITTLQRLIDTSKNPLEFIYLDNGTTEEDYLEYIKDRMLIVELVLDTKTYYIPKDRFASIVDESVTYSKRMIAVNLSFIPADEDISELVEDLSLLVQNRTGIIPSVKEAVTSADVQVDNERHLGNAGDREAIRVERGNYRSLYLDAIDDNVRLLDKLEALEKVYLRKYNI